MSNALQEAWKNDQKERLEYQAYLDTHDDWKKAAKKYREDKGIQEIFTDYSNHAHDHLDTTDPSTYTHEDWTALWGLAQHADHKPDLQKRTLGLIEEHKGRDWKINDNNTNSAYEYLSDRINVNEGKEQEFNTQNT